MTIKNNMDKLIIWQKWFDPFGSDEEVQIALDTPEDNQVTDDENTFEENSMMETRKHVRAIATPMGLIPYTENTASGKIFNFWIGHTNFTITKYIADLIEACDGVEILDVFTRYRFRVAIGKAFDVSKVMKDINDKVYEYLG
jgi:hypothetical protein